MYLLGHCYHCDDATINQFHYLNHGSEDSAYEVKLHNPPHIAHFLRDFQFIIWFSYRKDFPPLGPAQLTSGSFNFTKTRLLSFVLLLFRMISFETYISHTNHAYFH